MQKLHDIETSIYGKGEHKLGSLDLCPLLSMNLDKITFPSKVVVPLTVGGVN